MTNTAGATDRFDAAHAALKADPSIQFNLTPPPADPKTPSWLKALIEWLGNLFEPLGRFLKWIGSLMPDAPVARILLWVVLAAAAIGILWAIFLRLKTGRWRIPKLRPAPFTEPDEEEWAPDPSPAVEWLQEADALAEAGRYAEAVHHLLFRSIEDIARRWPHAVRPALTSREIGRAAAVPEQARDLFAGIAGLVERSLFGGRPVGREEWADARTAYADFALPQAWRA